MDLGILALTVTIGMQQHAQYLLLDIAWNYYVLELWSRPQVLKFGRTSQSSLEIKYTLRDVVS